MIKYNMCIRCNSGNVEKLFVNTKLPLNFPEERTPYSAIITQRVINPTDALVCKECGHIELFIDWEAE